MRAEHTPGMDGTPAVATRGPIAEERARIADVLESSANLIRVLSWRVVLRPDEQERAAQLSAALRDLADLVGP